MKFIRQYWSDFGYTYTEHNKWLYLVTLGALGKRTRFQRQYLAQLILEVKRKQGQPGQTDDEASPTPTPLSYLPKVWASIVSSPACLFFLDALFITFHPFLFIWLSWPKP